MTEYSFQAFDKDWIIGKCKITKLIRSIITIVLWLLTLILAIVTYVLLFTSDDRITIFIIYFCSIIPSLIAFVFILFSINIKNSNINYYQFFYLKNDC